MVKNLWISSGLTALIFLSQACEPKQDCKLPIGHWTDNEGREMIFLEDGKAFWLTRFGSQYDTLAFSYTIDCKAVPQSIEMQGFTSGPYTGRALFGIFEWSNDSTLRMQLDDGERPTVFDSQRASKFEIKKKEE